MAEGDAVVVVETRALETLHEGVEVGGAAGACGARSGVGGKRAEGAAELGIPSVVMRRMLMRQMRMPASRYVGTTAWRRKRAACCAVLGPRVRTQR